jgi:hypothetical protein
VGLKERRGKREEKAVPEEGKKGAGLRSGEGRRREREGVRRCVRRRKIRS